MPLLKLSSQADVRNPSPVNVAVSPHVISGGASTHTTHWEFDVKYVHNITSNVKLLI